jgi:hypothetical protein
MFNNIAVPDVLLSNVLFGINSDKSLNEVNVVIVKYLLLFFMLFLIWLKIR